MGKKGERRASSIFIKTLRKGIICSLIPLLVMSVFVFAFYMHRSVGQLGELTVNMLAQNDKMAVTMIEDMSRSAYNLARDPSVVDFSMRPYLQDVERNTNLCRILANLANSYDYVEKSFLISAWEPLQLNSRGQVAYADPEELPAYLEEGESFSGLRMQIRRAGEGSRKMLLTIGIPAGSSKPVAAAVLQVDVEKFLATAAGSVNGSAERDLYVFDREGERLFSDLELGEENGPPQGIEAARTGSGLVWAASALLQRSTFTSRQLGWNYVYVTDALSGDGTWVSLAISLVISVLAACGIGLLLAYQGSKELYSPLEQLISGLTETPMIEEIPRDEYQLLANYYDSLLNQRDEVYEQVSAIRSLLMQKFLASLVDGSQGSQDEIRYQVQVLEIPFQPTSFEAFLLQIDNYYALPFSEEEKGEIRARICAQILAHSDAAIYCTAAELDNETILVICNLQTTEPPETAKKLFYNLASELQAEVSGQSFTVTLGIGCICHAVEELPLSCKRAKASLAYKLYRGEGSVIDFDEAWAEPQEFYHDFEKVRQVINSVRAGDVKGTNHLLDEIFEGLTRQQFPPRQVRDVLKYLIAGVGEIIRTAGLTEMIGAPEELNQTLEHKKTLPGIEPWVVDICVRTAAEMKSNSSDRTRRSAEKIKDYIDSNLTKDISLSTISEYVNYSPTYVSKVFRQYYSVSYIDYLNSSRVRLAQELLVGQEDLSAKEIGFKVGFNNLQTFFRIFKKYTGMTPLQYRETGGDAKEIRKQE